MQDQENSYGVPRPLSPIEQGLLLHYFYESESVYVDQIVCDLVGELDVSFFEQAVQHLVEIHESLRTCYFRSAEREMRAVVRKSAAPRIAFIDLSAEVNARAVVNQRVTLDAEVRFDLSKEVSRCTLYRLEERLHVFVWTYHHVVADSWTLRLFQEQFCASYRALLEGATLDATRCTTYAAYVDWIAGQDRGEAFRRWAAYLKRLTSPKADPAATYGVDGDRVCVNVALPKETREQVDDVRRQCKVTNNVVLLGMWGVLALDQRQTSDCLLGCVVTGRSIPMRGIETVTGVCANTIPILIEGSKTIRDFLADLHHDVFLTGDRSYLALSDVLASAGFSHRDLQSVVNFTIDQRTVSNRHIDHLPFDIINIRYTQAANFDAYLDVDVHDTGVDIAIYFNSVRRSFAARNIRRKCEKIILYFADHSDGAVRDALDSLLVEPGLFDVDFAFEGPRSQ